MNVSGNRKRKKPQRRQTHRHASNYFLPYSTTEAEATRYICTYQKSLCFEFSTVQPTPPIQKNSMKEKRVRRRLEEMQCLTPRLRSRERWSWEHRWSCLPSQPGAVPHCHRAGSSRRKPDSTHLHQRHLWIMQPFQNSLIKTLLLSLHLCLWIRKSLF